jgi:hypothetical protein
MRVDCSREVTARAPLCFSRRYVVVGTVATWTLAALLAAAVVVATVSL